MDGDALRHGASAGLYVAGDRVGGKGWVGRALESGLEVAEAIRATL